jgi:hypothetical protein
MYGHVDETRQHWRRAVQESRKSAFQVWRCLLHHYIGDPVRWAKLNVLTSRILEGGQGLDDPKTEADFMATLDNGDYG